MRRARFKQVDVFTTRPFFGNPVAVVLDAEGLSQTEMLQIAAWTNLSETTFVLPSRRGSYGLRIFTPRTELPFAGHPTIGSAHAVREAGLVSIEATSLVQECAAGLVPLSIASDGAIHARVPRPQVSAFPHADVLASVLGVSLGRALIVDVGPRWIVVALEGADVLHRLTPDLHAMEDLNRMTQTTGVTAYAAAEGGVEVRSFAPLHGVAEDPVCGSGNAAVGAHLRAIGGIARFENGRYRARQGAALGRQGELLVAVEGEDVTIGGSAITVIDGTIRLD